MTDFLSYIVMEATNQGNSFIQSLGAHPLTKKPKDAGNEIANAQMLNTLKRSNKTCYIFVPRAAIPLVNYRRRWPKCIAGMATSCFCHKLDEFCVSFILPRSLFSLFPSFHTSQKSSRKNSTPESTSKDMS